LESLANGSVKLQYVVGQSRQTERPLGVPSLLAGTDDLGRCIDRFD
jgi:hypothetical protein